MSSPDLPELPTWQRFCPFSVFVTNSPRVLIFNSSVTTSSLPLNWPPSPLATRNMMEDASTENRLGCQVSHYYGNYDCLFAETKIRISHVRAGPGPSLVWMLGNINTASIIKKSIDPLGVRYEIWMIVEPNVRCKDDLVFMILFTQLSTLIHWHWLVSSIVIPQSE